MPISKKTQAARIANGECVMCGRKRDVKKSKRYCEFHRKYMRDYASTYRSENPRPHKNKCTICRKVGHTRAKCDDPRAPAIRAAAKSMVN